MPRISAIPCFVDTNVWLYAFIEHGDSVKSARASGLIQQGNIRLSTQVVNEVCVNLLKKAKFSENALRQLIDAFFTKYDVLDLQRSTLFAASDLRDRYSLSYWDSVIVASALETGAEILYSEDMQDGLLVNNQLRIVNPFAEDHT
ncbi:MAG TPA: PIN domain-containing protein [Anaerolineae bacterium]|nr:PIN domain-containing protein [Anaerolineae bacterium]HNU04551.1 PIN domain-containing protein [Anaerolineae bacterium]